MNEESQPSPHTDPQSEGTQPSSLTDAAKGATCPFMRTLFVNNPASYDEASRTMSRQTLEQFVRGQRQEGEDGSLERVLSFFARVNQTPLKMKFTNFLGRRDLFSTEFPGSRGDHPGSTDIYSRADRAFDEAAFGRVIAHSSDGTTMSHRDMAAAIIEANDSDSNPGSSLDLEKSAGEFALLFNLLAGKEDRMHIADMRTLFERNEWPAGSLRNLGRATRGDWVSATKRITHEIVRMKFDRDDKGRGKAQVMRDLGKVVSAPMKERW